MELTTEHFSSRLPLAAIAALVGAALTLIQSGAYNAELGASVTIIIAFLVWLQAAILKAEAQQNAVVASGTVQVKNPTTNPQPDIPQGTTTITPSSPSTTTSSPNPASTDPTIDCNALDPKVGQYFIISVHLLTPNSKYRLYDNQNDAALSAEQQLDQNGNGYISYTPLVAPNPLAILLPERTVEVYARDSAGVRTVNFLTFD